MAITLISLIKKKRNGFKNGEPYSAFLAKSESQAMIWL